MLSHHNIPEPRDLAMAQYSTPFCVALACYLDPCDPSAFSETTLNDRAIRKLCRKVKLELRKQTSTQIPLASRVTVRLKGGRELLEEIEHFPGTPEQPLDRAGLREKFETITAGLRQNRPAAMFEIPSRRRWSVRPMSARCRGASERATRRRICHRDVRFTPEACRLGCEGIVSKRLGSRYRSGHSPHWLKIKNPAAPAMKRRSRRGLGQTRAITCEAFGYQSPKITSSAANARMPVKHTKKISECSRRRMLAHPELQRGKISRSNPVLSPQNVYYLLTLSLAETENMVNARDPSLPAALVSRGYRRCLCREGQRRAKAGLCSTSCRGGRHRLSCRACRGRKEYRVGPLKFVTKATASPEGCDRNEG